MLARSTVKESLSGFLVNSLRMLRPKLGKSYISRPNVSAFNSSLTLTDHIDLGMPFAGHFFLFRPAILTAIDLSLKRLGVDSIDLYMV